MHYHVHHGQLHIFLCNATPRPCLKCYHCIKRNVKQCHSPLLTLLCNTKPNHAYCILHTLLCNIIPSNHSNQRTVSTHTCQSDEIAQHINLALPSNASMNFTSNFHPASTRKPQVALNWKPERTASEECDRGKNRTGCIVRCKAFRVLSFVPKTLAGNAPAGRKLTE